MTHVIQTETLVGEGVLTQAQADIIKSRSRDLMTGLIINALLCGGIIAAAMGFVAWLADPFVVAISGAAFLGLGVFILRGRDMLHMFGQASALIGAGMLGVGGAIEAFNQLPDEDAGLLLTGAGGLATLVFGYLFFKTRQSGRFVMGAIMLLAAGIHLFGFGTITSLAEDPSMIFLNIYATILVFGLGMFVNVRFLTALAIIPFAQILETSTTYWHAAYVFYSPEPTLTILQMTALMLVCLILAPHLNERYRRHTGQIAIMAFIVANLSFLVGSLFGDHVGQTLWGPIRNDMNWSDWHDAIDVWQANAFEITEHVYSIIWAIGLIGIAIFAALTTRRGFFNAALTFGAIHAYTQMFESFYNQPLAYVIGGLAAIPLAWSIWRLNGWFSSRAQQG
ncbi:hypothetical protein [Aestuariibius sp. HNIBRBA575]|uniref:hypothetical protein n=1 Tax=Aestuariibius sp. HNIBRBA575 TaxID=3233343 RepID=UPI0034A4EFDB